MASVGGADDARCEGDATTAAPPGEVAAVVQPDGIPGWPRWASKAAAFAQGMVLAIGLMLMFVGSAELVGDWSKVPILTAIPGVVLAGLASIAVHEAGHFAGARLVGMLPYNVGVGGFQAWASSAGWKFRLTRMPEGLGGFVMSHFAPDRPLSSQAVPVLVAGPAANLLLGAVLSVPATLAWPHPVAAYLAALAILSACVGIANLIPGRNKLIDNDGLQVLRWRRGDFDGSPEAAFLLVNGLSVRGTPANELPAPLLERLRELPGIGPLLHGWFRLASLRSTGQWDRVAEVGRSFEIELGALPPAQAKALGAFVNQVRTEVAFAHAMASGEASPALASSICKELHWLQPALRPRVEALSAALGGEIDLMRSKLEASRHAMRASHDLAYSRSEESLRREIAGIGQRARDAAEHGSDDVVMQTGGGG